MEDVIGGRGTGESAQRLEGAVEVDEDEFVGKGRRDRDPCFFEGFRQFPEKGGMAGAGDVAGVGLEPGMGGQGLQDLLAELPYSLTG